MHPKTLLRWKVERPEFRSALCLTTSEGELRVERGLYQRALGYDLEVEKHVLVKGELVKVIEKQHVPADIAADQVLANQPRPGELA